MWSNKIISMFQDWGRGLRRQNFKKKESWGQSNLYSTSLNAPLTIALLWHPLHIQTHHSESSLFVMEGRFERRNFDIEWTWRNHIRFCVLKLQSVSLKTGETGPCSRETLIGIWNFAMDIDTQETDNAGCFRRKELDTVDQDKKEIYFYL